MCLIRVCVCTRAHIRVFIRILRNCEQLPTESPRESGRMEKNRPCAGVLSESRTGERWRVSYAKKCASIDDTEKPRVQTKNLDTADEKQDGLSKPGGGSDDGQDEALDEV